MKRINRILGSVLMICSFTFCDRAQAMTCDVQFSKRICVGLNWIQGPWRGKSSKLELYFWDQVAGSPNGPYLHLHLPPVVEPLMDMDMDYSNAKVIQKSDGYQGFLTGVYEVTDLNFSMSGQWYLKMTLDSEIEKSAYFSVKKQP